MTDKSINRDKLDPGAYVGNEPELEGETLPGGVGPEDERTSANAPRPRIPGEPDVDHADQDDATKTDMSAQGEDGQVYGG